MNNTYHISWPLPARGTGSARSRNFRIAWADPCIDAKPGPPVPGTHHEPDETRRFRDYTYFHQAALRLRGCYTCWRLLEYRRLLRLFQLQSYLPEISLYNL